MSRASRVRGCVALVLGLVLAACGGETSSDDAAPEEGPSSSGPVGEVVFGFASDAGQNYDPHTTASIAVGSYLAPVFDSLVSVQGDGSIEPALATEWSFSDDATTLTLTLRDDVVFQDGTPFDAEAVKANIDRAKTVPGSTVASQLANVSSVEVVDDRTVALTLTAGAGTILPLLGGQAGMMISPDAFDAPDLRTRPIGTGPWMVADGSVPGSEMIYEAFDEYWDPSVQGIERFVVRVVAPETQTSGMLDGSIDVILLTSNPQDADRLEAAGNTVTSTGLEYVHTLFLSKDGVFADEHARLALTHALDRELIADTVLLGQCEVTGQPFKPESWAHDPDLDAPDRDDDLVQQELEAAGLPDGFEFTAVVSSAGTFLVAIAQAIQAMVAENDITMTVEPLPPAQVLQTYSDGGAQAYYTSQSGAVDPSVVINRLSTSLNPGGEVPATLTDLAAAGAATTDQAERQDAYQGWAAGYQEDAFHVSLCNQDVKVAHAANVAVSGLEDPLTVDPRGLTVSE